MKNTLKAKLAKLAAFSMAVATIANVGTVTATATEIDAYAEAQAKAKEMEELIEYLDPFVSVEENEDNVNIFVLDVPESVKDSIDSDLLDALTMNIESVNEEAMAEDVIITDNGTVYENSDEYVLQGGNIDKFKEYWWGGKRWACRNCAYDIQDAFNKISSGAWGVSGVGGLVTLGCAPVGAGMILGGIYDALLYGWCATDIGKTLRNYPNSGVIITLTAVSYGVDPQ